MKGLLSLLIVCFSLNFSYGQVKYKTEKLAPIPVAQIIDMSKETAEFNPQIKFTQIHSPGNSDLTELKNLIASKYPKNPAASFPLKNDALPPQILDGFNGNSFQGNSPLDNHLCISNGGQILSAINSNVNMRTSDGTLIRTRTLDAFTGNLFDAEQKYDPRVIYDPVHDRFIMTCLSGFASATSNIILGVSASNDVNGEWTLYSLDGNPFQTDQWTDYPMLSLSEDELFLTINLLRDNFSWQEGFVQTLIYQIDLGSLYAAQPLQTRIWSDINFDGKPIRNLCPVKYADETRGDKMILLSNRNFAISNDSIFILELDGKQDDENVNIDIQVRISDNPYGAPPNAGNGSVGQLQTNDARILDAILIDDQIQFVGNTRNHDTGFSDVYHGIISDVWDTKSVKGQSIGNVDYDLGYPGIAWTGLNYSDKDVIIVATHTSSTKFAGISAIYFDNNLEYSNLVEAKVGLGILSGNNPVRWGDYIGIQRRYDQPGIVFTAGTYGETNNQAFTWINKIASPNVDLSSVANIEEVSDVKYYPKIRIK